LEGKLGSHKTDCKGSEPSGTSKKKAKHALTTRGKQLTRVWGEKGIKILPRGQIAEGLTQRKFIGETEQKRREGGRIKILKTHNTSLRVQRITAKK